VPPPGSHGKIGIERNHPIDLGGRETKPLCNSTLDLLRKISTDILDLF
jgi:hypothetical protein